MPRRKTGRDGAFPVAPGPPWRNNRRAAMDALEPLAGNPPDPRTKTLADVLHACKAESCVPEKYWITLVRAMAAGDSLALHALYGRAYSLVLACALGITGDRETAGDVTVEVFHDAWRMASTYDPAGGTVLGWILDRARSRAIDIPPSDGGPTAGASSYASLWKRLARRIIAEPGREPVVVLVPPPEPEWEVVAPGISCRLIATDTDRGQVAMLVRLAPGVEYPPHTHAGVEHLYMFEGELRVDARRFRAGEYLRSEPGTSDRRVWTETGCKGVLITSTRDILL